VLSRADWGKRRLAYRIQKLKHAQYLYIQYLDAGPSISEIERILKYDDRVIRFLTVKLKDKVNAEERLAKPIEAPLPPEEFHSHEEEARGPRGYDRGRPAPADEMDKDLAESSVE
jgi:small subunit ribosomal protein S6